MTSKEFIEWQMSGCSYNQKKYYKQVLKDLEVKEKQDKILKILKKYLKNKSLELGIDDIVICCENEEDFNKIKEWLEKSDN